MRNIHIIKNEDINYLQIINSKTDKQYAID